MSWPLEPAPYDLLADPGYGSPLLRVQVKTCTSKSGGTWLCWITRHEYSRDAGSKRRANYPPDALDVLAVVDGDGSVYLIPFDLVAHQSTVTPRAYSAYQVANLRLGAEVDGV